MKVKICGLQNIQDVMNINLYKPDYAGFVMAKSKRQVYLENIKEMIRALDVTIISVAVVVNEPIDGLRKILEQGVQVLQCHGDESPDKIKKILALKDKYRFEVWKAIRIGDETIDVIHKQLKAYEMADKILLDKKVSSLYGGTGEAFSWEKLSDFGKIYPNIIVAGGLNIDNVDQGIKIIGPLGVDVSSGVETNGMKDPQKIRCFIEKARAY